MPTSFYKLAAVGDFRGQAIVTIFWYREVLDFGATQPTAAECQTIIDFWQAQIRSDYLTVKPTEYTLTSLTVSPYKSDGTPGDVLPVTESESSAGSVTSDMAGPANSANVVAELSDGVVVHAGGRPPSTGYWAVGPIAKESFDEAGVFDPSFYGANWTDLETSFGRALQEIGIDSMFPIKVSLGLPPASPGGARTEKNRICAYRDIGGVFTRSAASYRRSRKP